MAIIEMGMREFDEFAFSCPYRNFYQTSQYGSLMSKQGYKPMYIGYQADGKIKAAAMILIKSKLSRFKVAYAPRGYLIDFNNFDLVESFTNELKDYLYKKDVIYITIDPYVSYLERTVNGKTVNNGNNGINIVENLKHLDYEHSGFNLYFENIKPRWNMILNTDKPSIEVFNDFSKETRTKVRNAMRKGVEVYKGSANDLKAFYQMISKRQSKKFNYYLTMYQIFTRFDMFDIYFATINTDTYLRNTKLLYENEVRKNSALVDELQKYYKNPNVKAKVLNRKLESDKVLGVYKSDLDLAVKLNAQSKYIPIACNGVIKYGSEIYFLIDGINPKYKKFNGNHLLKWKIIEEHRNMGFTRFNLNYISGVFSRKSKFFGVYTFKKGFNTNVTEYIGEFTLIINRRKYNFYKSISKFFNKKKK